MRNKKSILFNVAIGILTIGLIYILSLTYQEHKALGKKIEYYEMFSASDTAEIIGEIIKFEITEKRLKLDSNNDINIQKYPYLLGSYHLKGFKKDQVFFVRSTFTFNCPNNYLNFVHFNLFYNKTANIIYFSGDNKIYAKLRKDLRWRIIQTTNLTLSQ